MIPADGDCGNLPAVRHWKHFRNPDGCGGLSGAVGKLPEELLNGKLADAFFADTSDAPLLFYIWGHSYEFDIDDTWEEFEKFCAYISGRDDVFYATNREVLVDNI